MKTIGEKIAFILKEHKKVNQKYDGLPYYVHLEIAVRFAKKYLYLIPERYHNAVIIGTWGHDLLEDTNLTYNIVKKELGEFEADIIFALQNEKGKFRPDRANDRYYEQIFQNHLFIFVKLCDRLANMYYSKTHGNEDMYNTYKKEFPKFKEKLYTKDFDVMWEELENIEFTEKDKDQYPKIEKFDELTVFMIKLPKPIPAELFKELYRKGVIPKKDLIKGAYYKGKCRNAQVALWNGYEFVYMRNKFNTYYTETIKHPEDDDGYDLFIPIEQTIKVTEEQRIKY